MHSRVPQSFGAIGFGGCKPHTVRLRTRFACAKVTRRSKEYTICLAKVSVWGDSKRAVPTFAYGEWCFVGFLVEIVSPLNRAGEGGGAGGGIPATKFPANPRFGSRTCCKQHCSLPLHSARDYPRKKAMSKMADVYETSRATFRLCHVPPTRYATTLVNANNRPPRTLTIVAH